MIKLSGVRVTYSGLISFFIGLVTVFTGLGFALILTRTLTAQEYGTWNLILGILVYGVIIEPVISYWATRETARTEYSQKTAIISGGVFSTCGIIIYLIISYFVANVSYVDPNLVILGFILVPGMFLYRILYAMNLGWKPHLASYGLLIVEVSKVPLALLLVYFLNMGTLGVIIALFVAQNISVICQIYFLREKIRDKIRTSYITKWFKLSWLTLYTPLSNLVFRSDILIFAVISESVTGLAIFAAASVIGNLVSLVANLTMPSYAKLLAGEKGSYLKENLTLMFYFAIPLASISIIFAKPALFALNPIYEGAVIVAILITIRGFLSAIINTFQQFIWGEEKVDQNFNSKLKNYVKSSLFKIPTVKIIDYSGYLLLLIIGLVELKQNSASEMDLVIFWGLSSMIIQVPLLIYLSIKVQKSLKLTVDFISLLKYAVTSIGIFSIIFFVSEKFLEYNNSLFEFLPSLLLFVLISLICYALVTYVVDRRIRNLVCAIINEIR